MNSTARSWTAPGAIAAATSAGLLTALLLEGPVAQAAGCLALAAPVVAVGWLLLRRR